MMDTRAGETGSTGFPERPPPWGLKRKDPELTGTSFVTAQGAGDSVRDRDCEWPRKIQVCMQPNASIPKENIKRKWDTGELVFKDKGSLIWDWVYIHTSSRSCFKDKGGLIWDWVYIHTSSRSCFKDKGGLIWDWVYHIFIPHPGAAEAASRVWRPPARHLAARLLEWPRTAQPVSQTPQPESMNTELRGSLIRMHK